MFKLANTVTSATTVNKSGDSQPAGIQNINDMFANGEGGFWFDPSDLSTMKSDIAGTTAAEYGGEVGKMLDKSGNGNHVEATSNSKQPTLVRKAKTTALNNLIFGNDLPNLNGSDYGLDYYTSLPTTLVNTNDTPPVAHGGKVVQFNENNGVNSANVTHNAQLTPGVDYSFRFYIKDESQDTSGFLLVVPPGTQQFYDWDGDAVSSSGSDISNVTVTSMTGGWFKVEGEMNSSTTSPGFALTIFLVDNAGSPYYLPSGAGAYIYGFQVNQGSTLQTHQVVGKNANDYTQYNEDTIYFLDFDGDDGMGKTSGVDMSQQDEITLIVAGTYEDDTQSQVIVELTDDTNTNTGSFRINYGNGSDIFKGAVRGGGGFAREAESASVPATATKLLTLTADTSDDSLKLQLNKDTAITGQTGLTSGDFASNASLNVGCKNHNSPTQKFNGKIYQIVGRGKSTSANELSTIQTIVAAKAGLTL